MPEKRRLTARSAPLSGRLQTPDAAIISAPRAPSRVERDARPPAEEWTYRFLGAALAELFGG